MNFLRDLRYRVKPFLVCDAIGHVLDSVLVREAEIVMQQRDDLRDA